MSYKDGYININYNSKGITECIIVNTIKLQLLHKVSEINATEEMNKCIILMKNIVKYFDPKIKYSCTSTVHYFKYTSDLIFYQLDDI